MSTLSLILMAMSLRRAPSKSTTASRRYICFISWSPNVVYNYIIVLLFVYAFNGIYAQVAVWSFSATAAGIQTCEQKKPYTTRCDNNRHFCRCKVPRYDQMNSRENGGYHFKRSISICDEWQEDGQESRVIVPVEMSLTNFDIYNWCTCR